jgi:hypothetical protein
MKKITYLLSTLSMCAILMGCAVLPKGLRPVQAFDHYDACAKTYTAFIDMAACGKKARQADCTTSFLFGCSREGDVVVQYADALAASVKGNEMTDLQAQKRWIEFKSEQLNAWAAAAAARKNAWAAAEAASRPAPRAPHYTCTGNGDFVNCDPF